MILRALTTFALLFCAATVFAETPRSQMAGLPLEVQDWIDRHTACEHFGGEAGDGDRGRGLFLMLRNHQTCFGILEEYRTLLRTYQQNKSAMNALKAVDVSWLGQQTNGGSTLPLDVAELQARLQVCEEVKKEREKLQQGEWEGVVSETFGEVCVTTRRDQRALLKRYRSSAKISDVLRSISFNPVL